MGLASLRTVGLVYDLIVHQTKSKLARTQTFEIKIEH